MAPVSFPVKQYQFPLQAQSNLSKSQVFLSTDPGKVRYEGRDHLQEILCEENTILWISKLCLCVSEGGVSLSLYDD